MHLKYRNKEQKHRYKTLLQKYINDPLYDKALGCLFGSCIGDALGAYCEFSTSITADTLHKGKGGPM